MAMEPREDLKLELQDPEFAKLYGADQARVQLALALVAARSKLGLKQREIADKLGSSQPYIAKLEKGDANPTIGKIGGMLALLGLRLITLTKPLLSEPIPQTSGFLEAANVTADLESIGAAIPARIKQRYQPSTTYDYDFSPARAVDYPRTAAVVGGSVQ